MLADLDQVLTAVFSTADDLPPQPSTDARRSDGREIIPRCVAQQMMNIGSDLASPLPHSEKPACRQAGPRP